MKRTGGFFGSIRGILIHYISKSEASLAAKSENAYLVGSAPSSADQREATFPYMSSPGVALELYDVYMMACR